MRQPSQKDYYKTYKSLVISLLSNPNIFNKESELEEIYDLADEIADHLDQQEDSAFHIDVRTESERLLDAVEQMDKEDEARLKKRRPHQ